MSAKRFEEIASALESRVRSRPAEPLPSIAALADEYHVAYLTMWKAMRLLADKGVVVVRMGARTVSAGTPPRGHRDRFIDMLRTLIQDGTWKTGEQVPKAVFFQTAHHVGQNTVIRAMRILSSEGLIHKRGRSWIVGREPPAVAASTSVRTGDTHSRVALMLFPWLMDANNFFSPSHLHPFVNNFTDELLRQGIRLEVVVQNREGLEPENTIIGINNILARIDALGERYCGLFAHDVGDEADQTVQHLSAVLTRRKPVIFFDSAGGQPAFTRSTVGRGHFFRLFFDEAAAVTAAVDLLVRAGHRTIGFPDVIAHPYPWVAQRIALAQQVAQRYDPPPCIISPKLREPFWSVNQGTPINVLNPLFEGISETLGLSTQLTQGIQAKSSVKRKLLTATPSLASLLKEGTTAFIGGNDYLARDYYYWFRIMGIDIPRDVSLISFDNLAEFFMYPLSTVDFGFTRLGYLAAHILIGDIPVKADAEGQLAGVCTVVDRGSVGVAKRPAA